MTRKDWLESSRPACFRLSRKASGTCGILSSVRVYLEQPVKASRTDVVKATTVGYPVVTTACMQPHARVLSLQLDLRSPLLPTSQYTNAATTMLARMQDQTPRN